MARSIDHSECATSAPLTPSATRKMIVLRFPFFVGGLDGIEVLHREADQPVDLSLGHLAPRVVLVRRDRPVARAGLAESVEARAERQELLVHRLVVERGEHLLPDLLDGVFGHASLM